MKTLKNIKKAFSLVLVIAIALITFTACSNNKNKEAAVITNVESTGISSDLETKDDEIIADEVSKEENKEEIKEESKEEVSDEKVESSTQKDNFPITPGIYKFVKQSLTFEDIYFEDESKILDYFQTRDINGVYGVVKSLGFNNFAKDITTLTENETSCNKVVIISKNESNDSELLLAKMYEKTVDSFFDCETNIIYEVKDGEVVYFENCPKFIISDNSVSILYPFSYVDSETNETVYTPLYIKAEVVLHCAVDIMYDDPHSSEYSFVENSATIESKSGFVNKEEAFKILAENFGVAETEIISTLENFELYFGKSNELYICNTEQNYILTKQLDSENSYLIYNSLQFDIINEYYDFELDTIVLNISIQIDENTVLKCKFFNN